MAANPPIVLNGPGYTVTGYNTPRPDALFANRTVGPAPQIAGSHVGYHTAFAAQANQLICRPVVANTNIAFFNGHHGQNSRPDPSQYKEILIFNINVATTLSHTFTYTSAETAILADYPTRMAGSMPYDSASTPLVACRGHVTADRILSQRASYIKAILVHIKGSLNAAACDSCQAAAQRTGKFRHYAGCVSVIGWYGNACSNCIHDDYTARCTVGLGKNAGGGGPSYDDWYKKYSGGPGRKDRDRNQRSRSPDNSTKLLKPAACSSIRSNRGQGQQTT